MTQPNKQPSLPKPPEERPLQAPDHADRLRDQAETGLRHDDEATLPLVLKRC